MKRGYKETEIGEIPEEWEIKSVEEVFELGRGRVISRPYIQEHLGEFPVYSSQTSDDGIMGYIDTYDFEGKYITWTTDGAKAGEVFYRDGKFNCTNVCGTAKRKTKNIDLLFSAYYLNREAKNHVVHVGNDKLMNNVFSQIRIILPPLPEQKKIAEVLSSVDESIRATQAVIEQAKVLKQGMLNQLLTKGIGHKMFRQTEIGEIPEDWEVRKVKEVFELGRGRVISRPYIQEHSGEYPVFSSQTSDNGVMGFIDTFDFEGEYITWTTDGAKAGEVFYRTGKFNCTNVCGTAKCKRLNINLAFMAYYLNIEAKKHVVHVGNDKLMNNIFGEIDIVIPKSSEQKKIGEILSSFDEVIQQSNIRIDNLQRIKSGLMQDLLSGKKRVKV